MGTLQSVFHEQREANLRQFGGIAPLIVLPQLLRHITFVIDALESHREEELSIELVGDIRHVILDRLVANPIIFNRLYTPTTPHWFGHEICPDLSTWHQLAGQRWWEITPTASYNRRMVFETYRQLTLPGILAEGNEDSKPLYRLVLKNALAVAHNVDDVVELFALTLDGVFDLQAIPPTLPTLEEWVKTEPVRLMTWAYSLNPHYPIPKEKDDVTR